MSQSSTSMGRARGAKKARLVHSLERSARAAPASLIGSEAIEVESLPTAEKAPASNGPEVKCPEVVMADADDMFVAHPFSRSVMMTDAPSLGASCWSEESSHMSISASQLTPRSTSPISFWDDESDGDSDSGKSDDSHNAMDYGYGCGESTLVRRSSMRSCDSVMDKLNRWSLSHICSLPEPEQETSQQPLKSCLKKAGGNGAAATRRAVFNDACLAACAITGEFVPATPHDLEHLRMFNARRHATIAENRQRKEDEQMTRTGVAHEMEEREIPDPDVATDEDGVELGDAETEVLLKVAKAKKKAYEQLCIEGGYFDFAFYVYGKRSTTQIWLAIVKECEVEVCIGTYTGDERDHANRGQGPIMTPSHRMKSFNGSMMAKYFGMESPPPEASQRCPLYSASGRPMPGTARARFSDEQWAGISES